MGAFLAAPAEVHLLTLVTRDGSYFRVLKAVFNPWTFSAPLGPTGNSTFTRVRCGNAVRKR